MGLDVYYFSCEFLDCCRHLYCGELKRNVLGTISYGLPQVYLVYLDIEMIQPGKSWHFLYCILWCYLYWLVWKTMMSLFEWDFHSSWMPFFINKLLKWLPWLNHFFAQVNKRHLRKVKGYNGLNVVFQFTTIKMMKTVQKTTTKITYTKSFNY